MMLKVQGKNSQNFTSPLYAKGPYRAFFGVFGKSVRRLTEILSRTKIFAKFKIKIAISERNPAWLALKMTIIREESKF